MEARTLLLVLILLHLITSSITTHLISRTIQPLFGVNTILPSDWVLKHSNRTTFSFMRVTVYGHSTAWTISKLQRLLTKPTLILLYRLFPSTGLITAIPCCPTVNCRGRYLKLKR